MDLHPGLAKALRCVVYSWVHEDVVGTLRLVVGEDPLRFSAFETWKLIKRWGI